MVFISAEVLSPIPTLFFTSFSLAALSVMVAPRYSNSRTCSRSVTFALTMILLFSPRPVTIAQSKDAYREANLKESVSRDWWFFWNGCRGRAKEKNTLRVSYEQTTTCFRVILYFCWLGTHLGSLLH